MYIQQISLLTVQHDEYLLLFRWKQIIIKVFIFIIFTLGGMRRRKKRNWFCCLRGGRGNRSGGGRRVEAREAGTLSVILCKYIIISVLIFSLFHFSKNASISYQSFFHHLLQFQCSYHRMVHVVKEVRNSLKQVEPVCQTVSCQFVLWHCLFYICFLPSGTDSEALIFTKPVV